MEVTFTLMLDNEEAVDLVAITKKSFETWTDGLRALLNQVLFFYHF